MPGVFLLALVVLSAAPAALAQHPRADIETLKKQLEELQRREGETKRQLEEMQRRLDELQSQPAAPDTAPADQLEQAIQELPKAPTAPPPAPALASQRIGGTTFRLIDISLDVLAAGGGSTVGDAELQVLQGSDHDPRKNGFTLQNVELSLTVAVDPYVNGEAHIVFFVDRSTAKPSSSWKKPS
jgi:hypothetical protein